MRCHALLPSCPYSLTFSLLDVPKFLLFGIQVQGRVPWVTWFLLYSHHLSLQDCCLIIFTGLSMLYS